MEKISQKLSNFSIGVDFLGPDPTSSKNKAEKNLQITRFANLNQIKEARKGFFGCYSVCETMKDTKEGYFIM